MASGKSGKWSDISKARKLYDENTQGMTDEEVSKMMFTRKAGGGLVDKKDALMAYYGGGKVKKKKRGY